MTKYEPRINPDALAAIDMHVHVEQDSHGSLSLEEELMAASAKYFKSADNRTSAVRNSVVSVEASSATLVMSDGKFWRRT